MKSLRKITAALGIAALSAAALAGCASNEPQSDASSDTGNLRIWSWNANMQPALDIWNKEHPKTQVTLEKLPADLTTAYQKIFAGVKAGTAADVIQVEYMALPTYLSEGALADLSDLAGDEKSAYASTAWDQVRVQGHVYALPSDLGPMAMYYNAALLKKYGLEVPKTWKEFEKTGLELKKKTDGKVYLGSIQTNSPNTLVAFAWQAGAHWWKAEGDKWKVSVDDPATKKIAAFWQKMVDEGIVWPWSNENVGQQMVSQGKIATVPYPSWWAPNLIQMDKPKGTFGVSTLPNWGGKQVSAYSGGSGWGVSATSKHKKAAEKFTAWLTQSPAAYKAINDEQAFTYPASNAQLKVLSQRETPFTTPDGSGDVFDVFEKSVDSVPRGWQWAPTSIATLSSAQDALGKLDRGSDLPGSIAKLQHSAVKDLKGQGFTVAR